MNLYHNTQGSIYFSYGIVGEEEMIQESLSFTSINDLFKKMATFFDEKTPTKLKIDKLIIDNFLSHKPRPTEKNNFFHETKVCSDKSHPEVISSLHFLLVQLLFDLGKNTYKVGEMANSNQ